MPDLRETLQDAKARVNPEGLALSTTLAGTSFLATPPLQAGITYALHEVGREIPTDTMRYIAIGLIALANIASIAIEAKTLNKQQYSSSPVPSTMYVATGKPVLSSMVGNSVAFVQAYGLNPVHFLSAAALAGGDEGRLFIENAAGVALALGLWRGGFNTLISDGHAEPVVEKMREGREYIVRKVKKKNPDEAS